MLVVDYIARLPLVGFGNQDGGQHLIQLPCRTFGRTSVTCTEGSSRKQLDDAGSLAVGGAELGEVYRQSGDEGCFVCHSRHCRAEGLWGLVERLQWEWQTDALGFGVPKWKRGWLKFTIPATVRLYQLFMTQDDILAILNMRVLRKHKIDLPSIQGSATLSGDELAIAYGHAHGTGKIDAEFSVLRQTLESAFQSFN